jgi:hypothetical protein
MPVNAGTPSPPSRLLIKTPFERRGSLVNVEATSRYGVASMRFFDRDGFGAASAGRLTIPLPLLGATAGRVVAVFRMMTATSRRNAGLDDVVTAIIAVAIGLNGA